MKFNIHLYFLLTVFLFSCNDKYTVIKELMVTANENNLKGDSIINDSILNIKFSRLTRPNTSGIEIDYEIPNEFKNKTLRIVFRAKARTNQVYTNSNMVISILENGGNEILLWKNRSMKYAYTDVNKWCWLIDSIDVPPIINKKTYGYVSVYPYLGNTTIEKFDVDTLIAQIKYKN